MSVVALIPLLLLNRCLVSDGIAVDDAVLIECTAVTVRRRKASP